MRKQARKRSEEWRKVKDKGSLERRRKEVGKGSSAPRADNYRPIGSLIASAVTSLAQDLFGHRSSCNNIGGTRAENTLALLGEQKWARATCYILSKLDMHSEKNRIP
ncbi:hypothetical protein RRG08_031256 [Elysia crispata]|uniref:Uncharacterized protein n=1 Tax=Elysia crispata TaxID=231223 RepID=A0AAE1AIP8_9GAST|nr:hypothetical protein RRG08_031256 [Elysia crispata]